MWIECKLTHFVLNHFRIAVDEVSITYTAQAWCKLSNDNPWYIYFDIIVDWNLEVHIFFSNKLWQTKVLSSRCAVFCVTHLPALLPSSHWARSSSLRLWFLLLCGLRWTRGGGGSERALWERWPGSVGCCSWSINGPLSADPHVTQESIYSLHLIHELQAVGCQWGCSLRCLLAWSRPNLRL